MPFSKKSFIFDSHNKSSVVFKKKETKREHTVNEENLSC